MSAIDFFLTRHHEQLAHWSHDAMDAAAAPEADDGSTELCIKIDQDGTISVYKETGEDETAEQSAQQVQDIGQALAWCLREYKAMGQAGAESQLKAGYASASAFTAMVRRAVGQPPGRFFAGAASAAR